MKTYTPAFLVSMFLLCAVIVFSCNNDDESRHETRYSADGKDSVVYVHYRDNNGQYHDFFLNYLMFRSLYGGGGYNGYSACHNYYNSNPAPRVNNYHTYVVHENRTRSTTTNTSGTSSSGSSSKNFWSSGSSSSKSYSSPSRSSSSSSSSRSYSSPSKSYSSPSRSYSSPSRSYSSPSRSYSSPSRH
jgi:hypothetical protein